MIAFTLALLLGASSSSSVSRGDLLKRRQYETSGDVSLFVDASGNNSNACTASGSSACLTITGALSKLPKKINNAVTITVATGNFTGAVVEGFNVSESGSLVISGTMANVTPTTGSATGTLSSATAGTALTTTWATATVTGAGWTANDFRGKWLVLTGGTGSGQMKVITSNTDTVLTLTGTWPITTPGGTTTFAIQDPASIINANVTVTPWDNSAATTTAGFYVSSSNSGSQRSLTTSTSIGGRIAVQQFKFTTTAASVRIGHNSQAAIRRNWLSVNANLVGTQEGALAFVTDNYVASASANLITSANNTRIIVRGNMVNGATYGMQIINGAIAVDSVENSYFGLTQTAFLDNGNSSVHLDMRGDIIDCNSSGGRGINLGSSSSDFISSMNGFLISTSISNCATGIDVRGQGISLVLDTVTGSGNTTAILANTGAALKVKSTTTLTGTTEISVDGSTYTLAAFRAFSPIAIHNLNYGTSVYE